MKKILSVFVSVLLAAQAWAFDYTNNGVTLSYTVTDATNKYVSVSKGTTAPTGAVTIPSTVTNSGTNYTVRTIANNAFENCSSLTSITIPNSVTSIGKYAFNNCSGLTTITFASTSSVKSIGYAAFQSCSSLTSITIPNSVTTIGEFAFSVCSSLTTINIPQSVTSIGLPAFAGCTSMTEITVNNNNANYSSANGVLFNKNKTTIIRYPLAKTGTTYSIPSTVTTIADRSFLGCLYLTSVTIPQNVTEIKPNSFLSCDALTDINVNSNNANYSSENGIVFNKDKTTIVFYPKAKTATTYTIPSSVTSIATDAFYKSANLTSIIIPDGVTSIGSNAFYGCSSLTSLQIPDGVTSIGGSILSGCGSLTSITLPFVGDKPHVATDQYQYPFGYIFGASDYTNSTGTSQYFIGSNINSTTYNYYYIPKSLTEVTITGSNYIPYGAFYNCTKLTSITIPNTVTSIGGKAFYNCSQLTSVTIPDDVTSIGTYAYYNSGTSDVTIPRSVTDIEELAFNKRTIYCSVASKPDNWADNWADTDCTVIWAKTVTTAANNASYGTVSGEGDYVHGATASLEAEPAEHYYFVQWEDGTTDNPRTFTVTENITCTATFAPNPVVTVNAEHGTFTGDGDYAPGETATIEVTPNHGYVFAGWEDDENESNPRTVTVTEDDIELTALFELDNFEITATAASHGTVSGGGSYAYLSTATLTAIPDDHYYFDYWNDDSDDDENPLTINVTDNATYTATFSYGPRITYSAEHGTVEGVGTYKPGKTVQLTAVPDAGYYFVKWGDNVTANPRSELAPASNAADISFTAIFAQGKTITVNTEHGTVEGAASYKPGTTVTITAKPDDGYHFVAWGDGVTTPSREVTVNDDMTLSVTFEINSYTVTASATNGTVSGGGSYTYGQEATLNATGATGYYFVKWSDNSTDNPHTITVTDDVNISATFSNMYTISVTNISNGTVTGANKYAYGTEATLKATAASGYHFVKWSDGNKDNPRTITVSANLELSPVFSDKYEVKLVANGKGKVTGGGEFNKDEEITIKAIANDHYHFVKWSDDSKEKKTTRTIVVTCDTVITATFDADKYEITVKKTDGGKVTGADTYPYGEDVTLKAVPDAGYMFVKWNDGETKNPRTITVSADKTYSAEFAPAKYTVNIEVENGTVTGAGNDFAYGAEATLTATPAAGYKFVKWSDGNTDNPRTVTITEDLALSAVFEIATAIDESAASAVNIYAYGNTIVVENATDEIFVYNAMGALVARTTETEIIVNATGVYIVKTGDTVKRVMVN